MEFNGCSKRYKHNTRFKDKILRLVPELTEYRKGRDIILTLREGCGDTIFEACDLQDDGICLVKAAAIIRNEIFR